MRKKDESKEIKNKLSEHHNTHNNSHNSHNSNNNSHTNNIHSLHNTHNTHNNTNISKNIKLKRHTPKLEGRVLKTKSDEIKDKSILEKLELKEDYSKYKVIESEYKIYGESKAGLSDGNIKTNQDRYMIINNPFNIKNSAFFGIMDGHGESGDMIAEYILNEFNKVFNDKSNFISTELSSNSIYHKLHKKEYSFIKRKFNEIDEDISRNKNFDSDFSGSTCNILMLINNSIICANVGDSRAIVVEMDDNLNFKSISISIDHHPTVNSEKERILAKGGIIKACDTDGPLRVWVNDSAYYGACNTRSMGDVVLKKAGIISIPEIIEYNINSHTAFIVLASDGVWEFLSNDDVINIIKPYFFNGQIQLAAQKLIQISTQKWLLNEQSERDDITCVLYFLKSFNK